MATDRITLTVPAKSEYAKTVRMTAAALVSRMGMNFDEVDDATRRRGMRQIRQSARVLLALIEAYRARCCAASPYVASETALLARPLVDAWSVVMVNGPNGARECRASF